MKINFKQPRYILPLAILPLLVLLYYVFHSYGQKIQKEAGQPPAINASVPDVSSQVRKQGLSDKLDAFRSAYKQADGNTAVAAIPSGGAPTYPAQAPAADGSSLRLDSIARSLTRKYGRQPGYDSYPQIRGSQDEDGKMASVLDQLGRGRPREGSGVPRTPSKEKDPMEIFRQQMDYVDSLGKEHDPAYKAGKERQQARAKAQLLRASEKNLAVSVAADSSSDFNTVYPKHEPGFIMAVIDENLTCYLGSRVRLRLMQDISAGGNLVSKGTYVYALVSGFSGQRVTLEVRSILYDGRILPVRLDIYDLDGLPGLFVPTSLFRDFTRDLGATTVQGVAVEGGAGSGTQFLTSAASKLFESSSSAIAALIRKNKAKIKYNSYIYLINDGALATSK